MRKQRVRSKHGFKGFGTFILGWFIGLISTLGLLVGVGYWAYTSVSVNTVEKWLKTDFTDNKGMEDLTLQKAVGIMQGIASNGADAYTLKQLEEDFGVKMFGESIYGISTDLIKNSPVMDLKQAINDTLDTATFNNVLSFMNVKQEDLGMLNTILESERTYYVYKDENPGSKFKLYTDEEHNVEVDFKYTIKESTVEFGNSSHTISTHDFTKTIKPRLIDLPLTTAMKSITNTTNELSLYKILGYERTGDVGNYTYTKDGQTMSGVMKSVAEYTIDELANADKFKAIYIYEVMGYERSGTEGNYIYTDKGVEVTGAMKAIAGKTIDELAKPNTINNMQLYEIMGYTRTGDAPNYEYMDGANKVTGAMKNLAGKTINELSKKSTIDNLKVYEIMGYERTGTEGNYSYTNNGTMVTGTMKALAEKSLNELSQKSTIDNMYIYEIMGYERTGTEGNYTYTNNGDEVSGVMETLAGKKIGDLSGDEVFNDITVADVMGYTIAQDGKVLDKNNIEITGLFAHLADAKINNLSSKIDSLTVSQILDLDTSVTGVLKSLANTTIDGLEAKINTLTVGEALGLEESDATGILKALYNSKINELDADIKVLTLGKALGVEQASATGVVKALYNVKIDELNTEIKALTLGNALDIEESSATGIIKALYNVKIEELNTEINNLTLGKALGIEETSATGVIKALFNSKINELKTDVDSLQIYQIMGYYLNPVDQKYYETKEGEVYSNPVTGIMGAIAGKTINGIDDAIDELLVTDLFDANTTTMLKLFTTTELNTMKITELPNKVINKINSATIDYLVTQGIITGVNTETAYYETIKDLTLVGLLNGG